MDIIKHILNNNSIDAINVAVRLLLSFILSGLIGLDRERHNQPAGLRTHILISVGSTLLMLLSIYIPEKISSLNVSDPGRIAAQVITGIGFLGAGAILKLGVDVKGLTTAATIWVVAGVGLVVGAGMYFAAFFSTFIILFALIVLDIIEKKFFHNKFMRTLQVSLKANKIKTDDVVNIVHKFGITIVNIDISQSIEKKVVIMKILVEIPMHLDYKNFYNEIAKVKGVFKVNIDHNI